MLAPDFDKYFAFIKKMYAARLQTRTAATQNVNSFTLVFTVDIPFCITNCRSLLTIVFRTWGFLCVNLSFASSEIRRLCSCAWIRCADGRPRFHDSTFCAASCRPRFCEQLFVPWVITAVAADREGCCCVLSELSSWEFKVAVSVDCLFSLLQSLCFCVRYQGLGPFNS